MAYDTLERPLRDVSGFSIGAVFARCLRTYRRRFVPFVLVAFAAAVPLEIGLIMAFAAMVTRYKILSNPVEFRSFVAPAAGMLIYLAFYLAQSALFSGAYRDMSGDAPALGRSVRDGLVRLPIVVAAVIVSWLAVGIGWVALAIPGIIIFTMTAITVPACVIERLGPLAAMSRSIALTKGHRWRILAIYLIEFIGGYGSFVGAQVLLEQLLPDALASIILLGLQAALIAFTAVLNTAVYFELRSAKDGVAGDHIATVFD